MEQVIKFSPVVQNLLNADAASRAKAVAAPYEELAKRIGVAVEAAKAHTAKAREERTNTWNEVKKALPIAANMGHSPDSLAIGLEVACAEAGIPRGSYSSYIGTAVKLYADVQDANNPLTLIDAVGLSIADARKRYRIISDVDAQKALLMEAVKDWTVDELQALILLARDEDAEEQASNVVQIAHKHHEEAVKAEEQKAA